MPAVVEQPVGMGQAEVGLGPVERPVRERSHATFMGEGDLAPHDRVG